MASELINWQSTEFFFNLKPQDIPPRGHPDRKALRDQEKDKCLGGFKVNGVFFPPTLYWLIAHWAIEKDTLNQYGITEKLPGRPDLRDNEWIIHNELWSAEQDKEDLLEGGCRQIGKSLNTSAILGRDLCLIKGCQDLLVVGSTNDRNIILSYLNFGMLHCTDFFRIPKIDQDKKATLIRYGVTQVNNDPIIRSQLHIRNTEEGQNTEVSAGVSIYRLVMDEIGKYPYAKSHETVKPALISQFGKRSSSLLTFTGGDITKVQDVQDSFLNPRAGSFRSFLTEGKETGLFLSGIYRQDLKVETTLANYLKVEPGSELDHIPIRVADVENANRILDAEYEELLKDPKKTKSIMHRVYNARKVNDMFLRVDNNPFGHLMEKLQAHKQYLLDNPVGQPVELYREYTDGPALWKLSEKLPIGNFPRKELDRLDAPGIMYDPPRHKESYYLHIAGLDPYNQAVTETSNSLGAFYILRRANMDLDDPFQDTMVFSYVARPEQMKSEFLAQIMMALEIYNGTLLHENSNAVVLNEFDTQQKGYYLADSQNIQHLINPTSKAKTAKGIAPTTPNKRYMIEASIDYLGEVIQKTYDEEGKETVVLGYTRILDPLLCEEYIQYNEDGNFDRVDGFGWSLVYNKFLNKNFKRPETGDRKPEPPKQAPPASPWYTGGSFTQTTSSPSSPWY